MKDVIEIKNAVEIVASLDEVQTVALLKQVNRNLLSRENLEIAKESLTEDTNLDLLRNLSSEELAENLDPQLSQESARRLLRSLADSEFSGVVVDSWNEIKNNDGLFIETIIALGLIANLTLLLSTTKVNFKYKGLTIEKTTAEPSLIREILNPLLAFIKRKN